jgi:hypothetical protein
VPFQPYEQWIGPHIQRVFLKAKLLKPGGHKPFIERVLYKSYPKTNGLALKQLIIKNFIYSKRFNGGISLHEVFMIMYRRDKHG